MRVGALRNTKFGGGTLNCEKVKVERENENYFTIVCTAVTSNTNTIIFNACTEHRNILNFVLRKFQSWPIREMEWDEPVTLSLQSSNYFLYVSILR